MEYNYETFSLDFDCELCDFATAIELFIVRPHLVDKRLAGAVICDIFQYPGKIENVFKTAQLHMTSVTNETTVEFSELIPKKEGCASKIVVRKVIFKKKEENIIDSVTWQWTSPDTVQVDFIPSHDEQEFYRLKVETSTESLTVTVGKNAPKKWLKNQLIPKLINWSREKIAGQDGQADLVGSLRLVSIAAYTELYNLLKEKHFSKILQAWGSETTNPEKFIHEDLGIATYLLLLWRSKKPKSFVDLGCGNGLLVYILSQEGIPGGVGLDLKKRKIWNFFRENGANLRVETIEAKADDTFKTYDWLLGNHSDELTPWIPVMAKLAKANYWVLPCCQFDFFGKYQRVGQKKSQYRDYLDFISGIGTKCGFQVEEDKLRIPSTKRICFIGQTVTVENFEEVAPQKNCELIEELKKSAQNFMPREAEDRVRNCTKVAKNVTLSIVNLIVKALLDNDGSIGISSSVWNAGKTLKLSEISCSVVDQTLLKELKSECGGLQTLLRNHNHMFIVDKGQVRLRNPASDSLESGKKRPASKEKVAKWRKSKPCWFHFNHPQGCPQKNEHCFWSHDHHELISP